MAACPPVVVVQRELGLGVGAAAALARLPLRALGTARWRGLESIPSGGVLLVANHVSWLDPVTLLDALLASGPPPRILAKQSLFDVAVVGPLLRAMRAVPVLRGGSDAVGALDAARAALLAGDRVVIYPDGTLTKDPAGWPMVGKTGAARLALATGVPVVPVAQWGAQQLLPRTGRPRPLPRPRLDVLAGDPVDLTAFTGAAPTPDVLRAVTEAVVDALVATLEQVRGTTAPPRWDPRAAARRSAGGGR